MFFKLTSRARARHTGVTPRYMAYAEGGLADPASATSSAESGTARPRGAPTPRARWPCPWACGGWRWRETRRAAGAQAASHDGARVLAGAWTLLVGARRLCTNCNIGINCVFASCMSESVTDRVTDTDVKLKRRGHLCPQTQGKPQQQHTSSRSHACPSTNTRPPTMVDVRCEMMISGTSRGKSRGLLPPPTLPPPWGAVPPCSDPSISGSGSHPTRHYRRALPLRCPVGLGASLVA